MHKTTISQDPKHRSQGNINREYTAKLQIVAAPFLVPPAAAQVDFSLALMNLLKPWGYI
jgi:hypothetical protein